MKRFFILSLVVLILASLLVLQATKSSSATVLIPSQLSNSKTQNRERIRVGGKVAQAPITYQTDPVFLLKFSLRDREDDKSPLMAVEYRGLRPDMFAVDRDVIVDGDFVNGVFIASNLLTQCPSKYEPPKPGESYPRNMGEKQ